MRINEIRNLKKETKNMKIGDKFLSEPLYNSLEEMINSEFISYYEIVSITKNGFTYTKI